MVIEQFDTGRPIYHPSGSRPFTAGSKDATIPSSTLLNPRYLLEYPTSALMSRLWYAFGWRGGAIAPILALQLAAGVAGIVLFYRPRVPFTRGVKSP